MDNQNTTVTKKFNEKDVEDGKALAIISYIGILALIPYLVEKNNPYVKFHAKEGLNLFLLNLIASTIAAISCFFLIGFLLVPAVNITSIVLAIIGIVNACNGEEKQLPIITKMHLIK